MPRTIFICLLVLTITSCGSLNRERRYVGIISDCGVNGHSTLTYVPIGHGEGRFAFAPGDGALIIRGSVARGGEMAGNLNTQPAGKAPFILSVGGKIRKDSADVTYSTATCRAQGQFQLVPVTLGP